MRWSLLFLLVLACSLVSAASHGVYPSFSAAEQGFVVDGQSLSVLDDAVYKTGWYSENGGAWQSFSLSGTPYGTSTDWLSGVSTASLPDFGVGEHYVIIYSCSNPDNWDCHGNDAYPDGFWQLQIINISADGGSVENYLRTFYVSNSLGDDANNGTDEQHPWQTLEYAESHATTPGDVIALKRGDVWAIDDVFEITHSGNATHDIVWDGGLWGNEQDPKATIQITDRTNKLPFSIIQITGVRYMTFQDIIINGNHKNRWGLILTGEHDITIQNCEIKNIGASVSTDEYNLAFLIRPWDTDVYNITVQHNYIHNVSNSGMNIYPWRESLNTATGNWSAIHDSYIGYNVIENYALAHHVGNLAGISFHGWAYNFLVEHNIVDMKNSTFGVGLLLAHSSDGIGHYPYNITYKYNKVYSNDLPAVDITDGEPMTAKFIGNVFSRTGSEPTSFRGVVRIDGKLDNPSETYDGALFEFYNNVIITDIGTPDVSCVPNTSNILTMQNNIFLFTSPTNTESIYLDNRLNPVNHSNNLYYDGTTGDHSMILISNPYSIIPKSEMSSWEPSSIIDNPLFVNANTNDFTLQSASPAIDAGVVIPGLHCATAGAHPNEDCIEWYGLAPDIGAFEYQSGPKTYYVSNSGNDSYNGTDEQHPWKTLDYAEEHATTPGDVIALKKGDIFQRDFVFEINQSGNSTYDIVWDGGLWGPADAGKAVIQSTHHGGGRPYWRDVVRFASVSYITFQNIVVDGNNMNRYGLVVGGDNTWDGPTTQGNEHNITIQNCELKNIGDGSSYENGLLIRAKQGNMSNITIKNNTIHNIASHGIAIYNTWIAYGSDPSVSVDNVYLGYNTVYDCRIYMGGPGSNIFVVRKTNNVLIEHNNLTSNGNGVWNLVVGPYNEQGYDLCTDNITIQYNYIQNLNTTEGIRNIDIEADPGANVNCPIHADIVGNVIYNNGTYNGGSSGIRINEATSNFSGSNISVYHNTIFSEGGASAMRVNIDDTNVVTAKNNIFYSNTNYCFINFNSGSTIHSNNSYYKIGTGNHWVTESGSYFDDAGVLGWEPTAVITNPLFVTNFTNLHLALGSPAIDAGVIIPGFHCATKGAHPNEDCVEWYGNAPDIGAFESIYASSELVGNAESIMLSGVPLIHNQTFLIPENAQVGDTVGDLNLMWVNKSQHVEYSLVDDDNGRFVIQRLSDRPCVSNSNLNYEIRISISNPAFDYDVQKEHRLTVRATDQDIGNYRDATITVKLSQLEKTIFINPDYTGGNNDGSFEKPFTSWMNITGNDKTGIITPGITYLQKRDSIYYGKDPMGFWSFVTGTQNQVITLGAYGTGERPIFDGKDLSLNTAYYASAIMLDMSLHENISAGYYELYSLKLQNWWGGVVTLGAESVNMVDMYMSHTRGLGIYFSGELNNDSQKSENALYSNVTDCYSEYAGYPGDINQYGFKSNPPVAITFTYTVARFNERHGFSGAGSSNKYLYCQALSSLHEYGYGIKVEGINILIDHTLIQNNSYRGLNVGETYVQFNWKTDNLTIKNSLIKDNFNSPTLSNTGAGIYISGNVTNVLIENTEFSGQKAAMVFWASDKAPYNYMIKNNTFHDNKLGFDIVSGGYVPPYPRNITFANNLFYNNLDRPIQVRSGSDIYVYNNIFYNNSGNYDVYFSNYLFDSYNKSCIARNNLWQNGISILDSPVHLVDHNMDLQDLFFVDANTRDFHLVSGSPAIDAGVVIPRVHCVTAGAHPNEDCVEWYGSAPDSGAFEYQG